MRSNNNNKAGNFFSSSSFQQSSYFRSLSRKSRFTSRARSTSDLKKKVCVLANKSRMLNKTLHQHLVFPFQEGGLQRHPILLLPLRLSRSLYKNAVSHGKQRNEKKVFFFTFVLPRCSSASSSNTFRPCSHLGWSAAAAAAWSRRRRTGEGTEAAGTLAGGEGGCLDQK